MAVPQPRGEQSTRKEGGCHYRSVASIVPYRMSRRIWTIVVIGALALGAVLTWFFGNFFYDLLWAFLDDHNISHAKVIAFTLAQLLPFVLAIIIVG